MPPSGAPGRNPLGGLCKIRQRRRLMKGTFYPPPLDVGVDLSGRIGAYARRGVPVTSVANVVLSHGPGPELLSTPEWRTLCTRRHNALFEGPAHVTESLLLLLQPYLRTPTVWKCGSMPLELPTNGCRALVMHNASALGRHEQAALSRWLDADGRQVVAATTQPLFPLIARGLFDEALYYRLNVMRLSIDSTGALV